MKNSCIYFLPFYLQQSLFSAQAQNQGKAILSLGYNYSLPTGAFKSDLISNGSARGFGRPDVYY